jgi:hypothetical protein
MRLVPNVLELYQRNYIKNHPKTQNAYEQLRNGSVAYFSLEIPDTVKVSLKAKLDLDLFGTKNVPFR